MTAAKVKLCSNSPPKNKSFIIIHNSIYEQLDRVSPQAERLYRILRSYSDVDYKSCYPSTKTLASRMKVSDETVRRAIKELEKQELIHVQRNCRGNRNIYHFESPHTDVGTLNFEDREPTNMTEESPQICEVYNKQESKNQDSEQQQTTEQEKQVYQKQTVVAVDNSDELSELLDEYRRLKSKLDKPPDNKDTFSKSFTSNLNKQHNPELVSLVLNYTDWIDRSTNTKVHNKIGFIKWQLKKPLEIDYSGYFDYLEKLYRKEQARKNELERYKQRQIEKEKEAKNKPSKEEISTFFKELKRAVGRR